MVLDVQNGIIQRQSQSPDLLMPIQRAIVAARSSKIQVIFVRVAFRGGYPEISPKNKLFSDIAKNMTLSTSESSAQIHNLVAPQTDEPVVTKLRISAFAGSDLEVILRSRGIETLILSGISTSGVVLSTLLEAADKDYQLIVLSDACLDSDPEVHRILVEKVFPRQAKIFTVDEWIKTL